MARLLVVAPVLYKGTFSYRNRVHRELVLLDDWVGQQLLAHVADLGLGLLLRGRFEGELQVLADPHFLEAAKAEQTEPALDGEALWVVHRRFEGHFDAGEVDHRQPPTRRAAEPSARTR